MEGDPVGERGDDGIFHESRETLDGCAREPFVDDAANERHERERAVGKNHPVARLDVERAAGGIVASAHRSALKTHGGRCLVVLMGAEAENGAHAVEPTSEGSGRTEHGRLLRIPREELPEHRHRRNAGEELFCEVPRARHRHQGDAHAPGFRGGPVAARHRHGLEVREPRPRGGPAEKKFAAPGETVCPHADAVERKAEQGLHNAALRRHDAHVGRMMVNGNAGNAVQVRIFKGKSRRGKVRMRVAGDDLGTQFEKGAHV